MTTHFRSMLKLILAGALPLLIGSCQYAEDPGPLQEDERTYSVVDFDRLEMGHAFQIRVFQGNFFEVRARGDRRNIDDLDVRREGTTLVIDYDENESRRHETYIYITMPSLKGISFSGASDSRVSGFDDLQSLDLVLSGASKCQLDASVEHLDATISGASYLMAVGEASTIDANISGASVWKGFAFPAADVSLDVSGASRAEVTATSALAATASGASVVIYRGEPTVTANASDTSTIQKD